MVKQTKENKCKQSLRQLSWSSWATTLRRPMQGILNSNKRFNEWKCGIRNSIQSRKNDGPIQTQKYEQGNLTYFLPFVYCMQGRIEQGNWFITIYSRSEFPKFSITKHIICFTRVNFLYPFILPLCHNPRLPYSRNMVLRATSDPK